MNSLMNTCNVWHVGRFREDFDSSELGTLKVIYVVCYN